MFLRSMFAAAVHNTKNGANKKQPKPRYPIDDIEARDILWRFVIRARRVEAHSLVQNRAVEK